MIPSDKQCFLACLIILMPMIYCGPVAGRANAAGSTTYDQKQTGKYNIHLNIKDVAIIAVGSDDLSGGLGDSGSFYEDYYDYDLDDFTISPISAALGVTTKKPIPYNITLIDLASSSLTTKPSPPFISPASTYENENISFVLSSLIGAVATAKPDTNSTQTSEDNIIDKLGLNGVADNATDTAKPASSLSYLPPEKPIANKTQSVVILSEELGSSTSLFNSNKTTNVEITTTSTKPAFITSTPLSAFLFGSSLSSVAPALNAGSVLGDDESQIPVHIIMEPVLQPKHRPQTNKVSHRANHRVYKHGTVAGHSAEGQRKHDHIGRGKQRRNVYNRCGRNQVLDREGRCQSRRSGL